MTATGALIARHVTDLFPTQTSRFDLAQAARRGVIAPLRCVRIPPGPGVRTIAKVPLRRGEVDTEFDQEMLAELLDQLPFNLAVADLYKTRFNGVPGVVYSAGVRHAYNVAEAFRNVGLKAQAVSGETKKRELARILAAYERGDIDVLVNAQLLAEGWNSPRATVCMHLAPTASKRIYQQRVGRVTRRQPGKEAGIVVDFVHPATKHDDPVVTLHSLLDRDVYRGGAIVVGPVRRGRGRRLRVERRVVPVTADENRRIEVFERELWRIAVEYLDYGEQVQWAALAGARVAPAGWRRARAMLHFDEGGELKRAFLLTAVERNKNPQLRIRALQEIAASRDAEAFDRAIEMIAGWPREEKREGVKVVLQSLAEKKIGRRDQANNWIWACAEMTREVHEEYAVQRWPETKRLLGLLVNSSGGAHARNARRLVHAARQQDRRLAAALLAAALPHTAESGEVINGARTRMSRKPAALARELLRNFPKGKGRRGQRRRKKGKGGGESQAPVEAVAATGVVEDGSEAEATETKKPSRRRRSTKRDADPDREVVAAEASEGDEAPKPKRTPTRRLDAEQPAGADAKTAAADLAPLTPSDADEAPKPKRAPRAQARRRRRRSRPTEAASAADGACSGAPRDPSAADKPKPKRAPRKRAPKAEVADAAPLPRSPSLAAGRRSRRTTASPPRSSAPPSGCARPCRPRPDAAWPTNVTSTAYAGRGGPRPAESTSLAGRRPSPAARRRGRSRRPRRSPPSQRTGSPSSASRARSASSAAAFGSASRRSSAASSSASTASTSSRPSVPAFGTSGGAAETLTPIPTTAQPSWGRPSTSTPATLRPSTWTSLGHFTRAPSPARSATASPARSESRASNSRRISEHSSADPSGACQWRPWRPRPAVCRPVVTSVPCGAPVAASSRARRFVESISRWCSRGRPSVTTAGGGSRRRARRRRAPRPPRRR